MFNLTKIQWAWYLALIFCIMAFIFSPVLPEGDLQWITEITRNIQLLAMFALIVLFEPYRRGKVNGIKEK